MPYLKFPSDKTVKRAKKILKHAEKDPEIKKMWEEAKKGKTTVAKVYREVKRRRRIMYLRRSRILSRLYQKRDTKLREGSFGNWAITSSTVETHQIKYS